MRVENGQLIYETQEELLDKLNHVIKTSQRPNVLAQGIEVYCRVVDNDKPIRDNLGAVVYNTKHVEAIRALISHDERYDVVFSYGTSPYAVLPAGKAEIDVLVNYCDLYNADPLIVSALMEEFKDDKDSVEYYLKDLEAIKWERVHAPSEAMAYRNFIEYSRGVEIPKQVRAYVDYARMLADDYTVFIKRINDNEYVVLDLPI